MKKNFSRKNLKKAFSLLELSVVILIISILITGSMTASVTAMNNAKYKVTRERINEIYKAMGAYLIKNKALPCPASIIKKKSSDSESSDSDYGVAGTAGTCTNLTGVYSNSAGTIVYGMVPVQTLGLNTDMAEDGFGNKFNYVVAKTFTNPDLTTGFGGATETGIITVKESIGSTTQLNTSDAILVIISNGSNRFGAFNSDSATQNSAATDSDEQKNYGTNFGASVDLAAYFVSSSINSDTFDDILFYKTRNMILLDFNALSLVLCQTTTTNTDNCSGGICNWPQTYYGQIVSSSDSCASQYTSTVSKPTKKCGAFGIWQTGTINPCTN